MAGKNDGINSTIGTGSVFEGKFYISGSLRIDGKFEGEIKTDEELVVGETGKVKTNIDARSVIVAGTVIGNITAREEVRLMETAKVLGDIISPSVNIQNGVVFSGQVTLTGKNRANVMKSIEDSFNGVSDKK